MIRFATMEDVPEMLAIYTPYVENTTVSFEYAPPTLEEFTHRFVSYTRQFPWLVWEEDGHLLRQRSLHPGSLRLVCRANGLPAPGGSGQRHRRPALRRTGGNPLAAGLPGTLRPGLRRKWTLPALSRKAGISQNRRVSGHRIQNGQVAEFNLV